MVIMWPQCSAIPECPNQVNLCFFVKKKKERETDRGDRKTEVNITRVSAANYIMYMLGIKSVNTFKTLKFTLNLKPKLKKNLVLPSLNHSLATCWLLLAISVLSSNTLHVKL